MGNGGAKYYTWHKGQAKEVTNRQWVSFFWNLPRHLYTAQHGEDFAPAAPSGVTYDIVDDNFSSAVTSISAVFVIP